MSRPLRTLVILLLAMLTVEPSRAVEPPGAEKDDLRQHWEIDKFRWEGPLGDKTVIEVENLLGDVRARISESDQVYFSAIIQQHDEDPDQADFKITEQDGRLSVAVAFIAKEGIDLVERPPEMAKRRIDLSILIPAGARLEARTHEGLIEAKGLESEVVASSISGDVFVSIAGSLEARTERGKIQAIFKDPEWDSPPRLETVTGDITVWLPNGAGGKVRAETTGLITTDYSIEIESRPASHHKTAVAKVGKGKRQLSIKSIKGGVRILRLRG